MGLRTARAVGFFPLLFRLDFDEAGVAWAASACGEDTAAHMARLTSATPVDLHPL
ncbi:MAG: hypothetical protein ABSE57_21855 [Bryobacteraceae bacterium]